MMQRRASQRGLTLLEVLVSVAIVAMVGTLLYGAFHGMSRARQNMDVVNDRYHQGRAALSRMSRELSSAFLSAHQPLGAQVGAQPVGRQTVFIGEDERPADAVAFTSFSHRRLQADSHESDQNELSYFAARDPDTGNLDLVRRESRYIDEDPVHGGVVQVLAEDIDSFDLAYLDPLTGEWLESWDSTQALGQFSRIPAQVWITLVLNGGPEGTVKFTTKVSLPIQLPLTFAIR